jgi:hypothetical protein
MVRRSALKYLPVLGEALPSNIIIGDVAKQILTQALKDNKDSVPFSLPASISPISDKLNDIEQSTLITLIIKSIVESVPGGSIPLLPMNFRRLRNHFPSTVL